VSVPCQWAALATPAMSRWGWAITMVAANVFCGVLGMPKSGNAADCNVQKTLRRVVTVTD